MFASEINRYCRRPVNANFQSVSIFHDLTERRAGDARCGRVDLYVVGFPCQPFSSSGSRRGFEDTGSGGRGIMLFHVFSYLHQETITQSIRDRERAAFKTSSCRPMLPRHYGFVARLGDVQFVRCRVKPRGRVGVANTCSTRSRFPICATGFRFLIDVVLLDPFLRHLFSSCSWRFRIAGLAGSRGETMVRTGIVVPSEQHDVVAPLLLV